jgi:beta-glucosidase
MGLVSKSISNRLNDASRQRFFSGITAALKDAIMTDKVPITSFIAWSLLDNFFLFF